MILQHTLMSIMDDIDEKNNIISNLRSRHEERENWQTYSTIMQS